VAAKDNAYVQFASRHGSKGGPGNPDHRIDLDQAPGFARRRRKSGMLLEAVISSVIRAAAEQPMQVRGYGAIQTKTEIIASDTTITSRSVKSHAGMRCWGMAFKYVTEIALRGVPIKGPNGETTYGQPNLNAAVRALRLCCNIKGIRRSVRSATPEIRRSPERRRLWVESSAGRISAGSRKLRPLMRSIAPSETIRKKSQEHSPR